MSRHARQIQLRQGAPPNAPGDGQIIGAAEYRPESSAAAVRVSSFAVCNGRLYAAVGQQIYERVDGETPEWRLVYSNWYPGHSETGLRGLTAVPAATGGGEALLAAVEGGAARIVRVDPRDGSEGTELDLPDFLRQHWGMSASYVIAAYTAGHGVASVGYGRLEAGGWSWYAAPTGITTCARWWHRAACWWRRAQSQMRRTIAAALGTGLTVFGP